MELSDKKTGICTIEIKQKNSYIDFGDFPCTFYFEKNNEEPSWVEIGQSISNISSGDRIKFERSIYNIENKINDMFKIKKDTLESSFLKLEDMGIPIERGIRVPISEQLSPEDSHFVDQWIGRWTRNVAKNYDLILNGETIKILKNLYQNQTAIIVGAGPSLDKNIDELKNINAIIIATDRAYKPLLARNINPDFVVSVDCHDDLILNYLDKADSSNHTLILNSAADWQIARHWLGRILYYNMAHAGMQFCDKVLPFLFPKFPAVANVGCVVNTALIIGHELGCKNLILVGCDFSYPENKISCNTYDFIDGVFKKIEINEKDRFEKRSGKVIKNGLYTYPPFLDYLETMKELGKFHKFNIINATEGGIIDCFPEYTLKEAKLKYCSKEINKNRRY